METSLTVPNNGLLLSLVLEKDTPTHTHILREELEAAVHASEMTESPAGNDILAEADIFKHGEWKS